VKREESSLALVLDTVPYRDRDLIVKLFTAVRGTESAMAYSARKSRGRFPSGVDRLTLVEVEWTRKDDSMAVCRSVITKEVYWGVKSDIEKSAVASLLCEMLLRSHVDKSEAESMFDFACSFLAWLDGAAPNPAAAALAAVCFTLRQLGFLPPSLECPDCEPGETAQRFALDSSSGSLSCHRHSRGGPGRIALVQRDIESLNSLLQWPGDGAMELPAVPTPRDLLERLAPMVEHLFSARLNTLRFLLDVIGQG